MKREIITTGDGSTTIHLPEWNEQYHSKHGAINEALHVFIKMGLDEYVERNKVTAIRILEIGFGTGLNALLTAAVSNDKEFQIKYTGVEAYPVILEEALLMNYAQEITATEAQANFETMHTVSWEEEHTITSNFSLTKRKQFFAEINDKAQYDIVYFDAFGARVQPELWNEDIFQKMYDALDLNGILVTYAAKGSVRRAMQAVGFEVERLPGPPGKREMLRALKV